MKSLLLCATSLAVLAASSVASQAEMTVVATIKPLHSLVAGVMGDVGTPTLIIEGSASPHNFQLTPSKARALQDADLVFWIDETLEPALGRAIEALSDDDHVITMLDMPGLSLYPFREGGAFEAHDHDDDHHDEDHSEHDHDADAHHDEEMAEHHGEDDHDAHAEHDEADDDHDAHAEKHEHGSDHEEMAAHHDEDDEHEHDAHGHGAFDPHIWLDPQNAVVMVDAIETALSDLAPEHHEIFHANAAAMKATLGELEHEIEHLLEDLTKPGYIVFHDAYQSFENRFGLPASGSLTVNPDVPPGAARLRDIEEHIEETGASCIFAEPQFSARVVNNIAESADVAVGILDPLGASLEPGPALYGDLLTNMATTFKACLSGT